MGPKASLLLGLALITGGMVLGYWIEPLLLYFETSFLIINIAYSLRLKHLPFLDLILATLTHTLRPVMAICIFSQLRWDQWPAIATVSGAWLGYNLLKRHRELVQVGGHLRKSLQYYSPRGLLYSGYCCLFLMLLVFIFASGPISRLISALGFLYFLFLLFTYLKGGGGLRDFVNYMLTN